MNADSPLTPSPFFVVDGIVSPDWIDFNGHMNVGYYGVALDKAADHFFDYLGIGEDYRAETTGSFFTVESHFTYQAELKVDERYRVTQRLVDLSGKAVHFWAEMHKLDGTLSATAEWLHLHMDMSTRKVADLPEDRLSRLKRLLDADLASPRPDGLGRIMGIKRKS